MKETTAAGDLLATRAHKSRAQVTVTFQVTDRCNYECVHCYQDHTDKNELSLQEISRVLHQLADAGVLFLTLMGGEFFMRRDADEILKLAHELGFAIRLFSTGHHITDKRADFLATLRPLHVEISLYSPGKHTHEQVTRSAGSWDRSIAATKRLIARKIPVILKSPVMEINAAEIDGLATLAQELGAQYTFDAKITSMDTGEQSPIALRMGGPTLRNFYDTSMADYLASTYAGHAEPNPDPAHEIRPLSHTPCGAGQQSVAINPQGQVWPCNALPIACGDLRTQSFDDIWSGSTELVDVRELTWAKLSECNACELRAYCSRCHGMAMLEHGEIRGPSLEACRHAVTIRDSLRDRGLIPATDVAMPPTWDRVDLDGQHARRDRRRPAALRVI